MVTNRFVILFLAAGLAGVGAAVEQKALSQEDVLTAFHRFNQVETTLGKMAQDKGQSDDARQLGQVLVHEHSDMNVRAKSIAKGLGVTLSGEQPAINNAQRREKKDAHNQISNLKNLSGPAFDRAFSQALINDHENMIAILTTAQKSFPPSPTRDLITTVLPMLEKHVALARSIAP